MKRIVNMQILLLFIFALFLAFPAAARAAKAKEVKPFSVEVVKKTHVYADPSKKAKIIATIEKGQQVTILAVKGKWYKVRTKNDKVGYAPQSEVGKVSAEQLKPAAGVGAKPETAGREAKKPTGIAGRDAETSAKKPEKPSDERTDNRKPEKPTDLSDRATGTDAKKPGKPSDERTDNRKPEKPSDLGERATGDDAKKPTADRRTGTGDRQTDKPSGVKPAKPSDSADRTATEEKPKPGTATVGSDTPTTVSKEEEENEPKTPTGVSSKTPGESGTNKRTMCASIKGGIGFPFLESYTLGLEADYYLQLLRLRNMRLFGTAAVGMFPLGMAQPLGDKDLDLEGYWVPIHAGVELMLDRGKFKPYIGLGVGGHLYGFDINTEETDLELEEDEDDSGRDDGRTGDSDDADDSEDDEDNNDTYEVSGFGFGGRAVAGAMYDLGAGDLLFEAQLYGHTVEEDVAVSFALFLGYHLCW